MLYIFFLVLEILKKLCARVSYLTLLLKGVADDVSLIKLQMESNTPDILPSNPSSIDEYNFPFTSTESLEEFEKTLENKENYLKFVSCPCLLLVRDAGHLAEP